jgi:iron complex outermembrane receptor protein
LRIAVPPTVLIRGDSAFQSEELIAYEIGYRNLFTPRVGIGISLYYNDYDHLRSQETSPGGGFPIVLANNLRGHTYGAEISSTVQLLSWWRFRASYSNLQKHLEVKPGSTDLTEGKQEGIDPRNQYSLRSEMDLPFRTELDFFVRYASALHPLAPSAPIPAYTAFDARAGWRPVPQLEISVVGRNLTDRRHIEFGPQGEMIPRDVFGTVKWAF